MKSEELSEVQIAFLQALWELGEGMVGDVQAWLANHGRLLASTTVATVLRRLESKGWVTHRQEGRFFIYRAVISRKQATGKLLDRLTNTLFGGDVPALVSQLLDSRRISQDDIAEIKRLIEKSQSVPSVKDRRSR